MEKIIKIKSGKEVLLRNAQIEDAKSILDYLNKIDSEIDGLLFEEDVTLSVDQQETIINNYNQEENDLFSIVLKDNEIVSISKLSSSQGEKTSHISNMAISISKACDCESIREEITKALIEYAKEETLIKTINLMVNIKSEKDIKLFEQLGFEKVGVFKDYFYLNEEYIDAVIMNNYLRS